jgi:hypothetical protein
MRQWIIWVYMAERDVTHKFELIGERLNDLGFVPGSPSKWLSDVCRIGVVLGEDEHETFCKQ